MRLYGRLKEISDTDSSCPDLPVWDRDRGGNDRFDITEGGNE